MNLALGTDGGEARAMLARSATARENILAAGRAFEAQQAARRAAVEAAQPPAPDVAPPPPPPPPRRLLPDELPHAWLWLRRSPLEKAKPRPVTIALVQEVVAFLWGVRVTEMISARRAASIIGPRHAAMWLAKKYTLRSMPIIGRAFGGRDHTTVLHAVRKVEAWAHSPDSVFSKHPAPRSHLLAQADALLAAYAKAEREGWPEHEDAVWPTRAELARARAVEKKAVEAAWAAMEAERNLRREALRREARKRHAPREAARKREMRAKARLAEVGVAMGEHP